MLRHPIPMKNGVVALASANKWILGRCGYWEEMRECSNVCKVICINDVKFM